MATEAPAAGPTPEDIQHDMQGTRDHLAGQVGALGDKVLGMAHDVNAAVAGAIQGGKDAAQAVGDAVRDATASAAGFAGRVVDVRRHVRRYPWPAVGAAVALGFICARLITRR